MEEFAIDNPAYDDETTTSNNNVEGHDVKEEGKKPDIVSRTIEKFWMKVDSFYKNHSKIISLCTLTSIAVLFLAYFIAAVHYKVTYECDSPCDWQWCSGHGFLIILTAVICSGLLYFQVIKKLLGRTLQSLKSGKVGELSSRIWSVRLVRIVVYLIAPSCIIVFLILDTVDSRERLKSLLGLAVLLILGALFSRHPGKINWQPVLVGLLLQFVFGLLTIRWEPGRKIFQCFGDKVTIFLNYTYAGASFVYGEELAASVFAFQVLSTIFFFSFFVQILYYWGAMQWFVMKLGWALQFTMGTTVCESVNTAASIFLGQSEAPLVIKPYIKYLTKSEIHAIMTAGFATVSGSVLAAYISFGVSASHLLTASIMSAPAALCYAKLFYPESEESKTKVDNIQLEKSDETGVLDAATKGAMSAISLVLGIIANLIAFVSAINFLDGVIGWMGELVGLTGTYEISFTSILTKIFYPLVWLMGVPGNECSQVAKVVALKTVVNEFVAYEKLGELIRNNQLTARSKLIATYALCGFSNPSSIGILIGALSSMAPDRRSDISSVAFRAFLSGCAVCFLTACVAGVIVPEDVD